jgi:hypothetical protein
MGSQLLAVIVSFAASSGFSLRANNGWNAAYAAGAPSCKPGRGFHNVVARISHAVLVLLNGVEFDLLVFGPVRVYRRQGQESRWVDLICP